MMVVIIVYPLLIYPIKVSITSWSGHDYKSRKGYIIMSAISVAYVLLSMAISMGLNQILIVLGLFGAIAGCVIFLVVPFMLIMNYHKTLSKFAGARQTDVCVNTHAQGDDAQHNADVVTVVHSGAQTGLGKRADMIVAAECLDDTCMSQTNKMRFVIGYVFIAGSIMICGVSAYMNIM